MAPNGAPHEAAHFAGNWTHSFEEDDDGVQVFRLTDQFAFPPSRRGRETLQIGQSGQLLVGAPGPDDRQRLNAASLTPLGMQRFRLDGTALPAQVIEIVEAGPEMLKLRYV
jgi:hypothetical protein